MSFTEHYLIDGQRLLIGNFRRCVLALRPIRSPDLPGWLPCQDAAPPALLAESPTLADGQLLLLCTCPAPDTLPPDYVGWLPCQDAAPPAPLITIRPAIRQDNRLWLVGPYHWIAQVSFAHDSWTAPRKIRRLQPSENINHVTVEQIKELLQNASDDASLPIFVFDAGYEPGQLALAWGFAPSSRPHPLAIRTLLLRRSH